MPGDKDQFILNFIQEYTNAKGYPPTYEEIGDALGVVKSAIHYRVRRLVQLGIVSKEPRKGRTLRVVKYDGIE